MAQWNAATYGQAQQQELIDRGVIYTPTVMTAREFKRQVQVPLATKNFILDIRISSAIMPVMVLPLPSMTGVVVTSGQNLAVNGAYIYDCEVAITANPVTNITALTLRTIRGILTIPNVVLGTNGTLTPTINGVQHVLTFPTGFYTLAALSARMASQITTVSGLVPVMALDATIGTLTVTMPVGNVISFTTDGLMSRFPQFFSTPLTPPAVSQTFTGCWLFLTRTVYLSMPEITRMVINPTCGNVPSAVAALAVIPIAIPSQPQFVDMTFNPSAITVPFPLDERITHTRVYMADDRGIPLASYCSQVSDWMFVEFTMTR